MEKGTPPPMLFSELMDAELPKELAREVEKLLDLKVHSPEIKEIPRINKINEYLDVSLFEIQEKAQTMDEAKTIEWTALNELFLEEIL